jgi:hypothetical protein
MKPLSTKKLIASALCLTASANLLIVQSALASSVTCRDYFAAYVAEATSPSPSVVVVERPHYHGHYPEYHEHHDHHDYYGGDEHHGDEHHGGGGGEHHGNAGGSSDDVAAVAIIGVIAAGLITTSIVEDAELSDAQNMINIIDEAQMGDGPELRTFTTKVQSNMKASVTEAQVADAVVKANENLEFCPAGDLNSVSEFAERIARDLTPAI